MSTITPLFYEGFEHSNSPAGLTGLWDVVGGSYTYSTTAGRYGTRGLQVMNGGTVSPQKWFPGGIGHFLVCCGLNFSGMSSQQILIFQDATNAQLALSWNAGTNQVTVVRGVTGIGTHTFATNVYDSTFRHWTLKGRIGEATGNSSTYGYIKLFMNQNKVYELLDVDTQQTANAYWDRFQLWQPVSPSNNVIDDIVVCSVSGSVDDDILGDARVPFLRPSGVGTTTQWSRNTGSTNWEQVDDTAPDGDTTYVHSNTANQIDTYVLEDLAFSSGTVLSAMSMHNMRKDDAGNRDVAPVMRRSGTEVVGTTVQPLDSYRWFYEVENVDPTDSAAWDISRINALEVGQKLIT